MTATKFHTEKKEHRAKDCKHYYATKEKKHVDRAKENGPATLLRNTKKHMYVRRAKESPPPPGRLLDHFYFYNNDAEFPGFGTKYMSPGRRHAKFTKGRPEISGEAENMRVRTRGGGGLDIDAYTLV